jgi:hypothetical protein
MPKFKDFLTSLKSKQVTTTFKIGNFIWTLHKNPFKRLLANVLLSIFHKRYSKNALSFIKEEKTKDDSF